MNQQELQELAHEVILSRAYGVDLEEINSAVYGYTGENIPHDDAREVQLVIQRSLVRVTFPVEI